MKNVIWSTQMELNASNTLKYTISISAIVAERSGSRWNSRQIIFFNATVGAMIDRFTNTAQFIIYSRLRHDKQALIETASASVYEARSRRYWVSTYNITCRTITAKAWVTMPSPTDDTLCRVTPDTLCRIGWCNVSCLWVTARRTTAINVTPTADLGTTLIVNSER